MATKTVSKKTSRSKVTLTSLAVGAMVLAARPDIFSTVYATSNEYQWQRPEDIDRLGGDYVSAAISATGNHMMLAVINGGESEPIEESPLYISADSGLNWENVAEDIEDGIWHDWTNVDVSNNGQVMVASSDDSLNYIESEGSVGKLFMSANAGGTWQDITPAAAESDDWDKVVVSGDGTTIAAVENDDSELYISSNGGNSWTSSTIEDIWDLKSVSISDDGETILVGGENGVDDGDTLHKSENGGSSWEDVSPFDPADEAYYFYHDLSADGQSIIVASHEDYAGGENVYASNDGGDSYTEVTPNPEELNFWSDTAISDDGEVISAVSYNGGLFLSDDFGETWSVETPSAEYDEENDWISADLNSDGTEAIAANEAYGYISATSDDSQNSSNTANFPNSENGNRVLLTTPDGTTITCSTAVKEVALAVQDAGYQYPMGLVDFCFDTTNESNEVTLTFITNLKAEEVIARKYNPNTEQYSNLDDVTINETTYQGDPALEVIYTIVDNGPLDLDPDTGEISDPVGLAVAPTDLAETGDSSAITVLFATAILSTVAMSAALPKLRKVISKS